MTHAEALRAQIEQIEAEVRKDPRLIALEHMKAALAALAGDAPTVTPTDTTRMSVAKFVPQITKHADQAPQPSIPKSSGSKISRLHEVVGGYIDANGPTHRSRLVEVLVAAGEMQGIKVPIQAFSTSMHTLRAYFESDGKGTFRRRANAPADLAPAWPKKANPEQGSAKTIEGAPVEAASAAVATGGG